MLNPTTASTVQLSATCKADSSLSFTVTASSEILAKVLALDKIGYVVEPTATASGEYDIMDADTRECEYTIAASSAADAITAAFSIIGWRVSEPQEMVGGSLGSGFHVASDADF